MKDGAKTVLCVLGVLLLIVAGHGYRMLYQKTPFDPADASHDALWDSPAPSEGERDIRVRIDGSVAAPGIYRVPAGTTVGQLIEGYAGGALQGADVLSLDLQQALRDGSSVYVP